MRKLMYFAAALLVLAGCNNKDNALNNAPEGTPFKKGQQVTLTVGTGDNANQAAPRRVAGRDNTTENRIDFTWEEGDKILVKVGDQTAEFTLSSTPGENYGEFTGTMPADGSMFDIQYPINVPNITKQVYTTEKPIPADSMLFAATNCTLDNEATLFAQHAMVQFNLYGIDMTVGMIIFKNITAEPAVSDTLICTGGKTIGATAVEATPFYMVVPAGEYQFEVEVYDAAATPAKLCSFATSEAKTFVAGDCLNMPAKFVPTYVDLGLSSGVKWATCNVGATTPEGYGDCFAWGETETYYNKPLTDPISWKTGKTNGYDWQSYRGYENAWTLIEWNPAPYADHILKPEYDAAHVNWGGNWRMPTKAEIQELINPENCEWKWCDGETEKYNNTTVKGYLVKSLKEGYTDNSIFLPFSGYGRGSSIIEVGSVGVYWSSWNEDKDNPVFLDLGSSYVDMNCFDHRYYGRSVRPVYNVVYR